MHSVSLPRFKSLLFRPQTVAGIKLLKFNTEWHLFKRTYERPLLQLYAQVLKTKEQEWKQTQKQTTLAQKEETEFLKAELGVEKQFARKRMLEWFQTNQHSWKDLKKLTRHPFDDFFTKFIKQNLDYASHLDGIEQILDSEAPALEEAGLGPIPHTSEFWKPSTSSSTTDADLLRGRLEALRMKAQVIMSLKKKAGLPVEWVHSRLFTQVNALQKYISDDSQIVQLLKYQDIPNDVIQHMVRLYGLWIHKEFRLVGDWTQPNISEPPPSLLSATLIEEQKDSHTDAVSQQYEWDLPPPRVQALSSKSLDPSKDLTLNAILEKKKKLAFPAPVARVTNEEPIEFITVHYDKQEFQNERRKRIMESKVKMRVKLSVFNLSPLVTARLGALAGNRYDPDTGVLTIVGDRHDNRHHNWMYVKVLFRELLQQAHMIDPKFVPIDDLDRSPLETKPRDTVEVSQPVDDGALWKSYNKFVDAYQLGECDLGLRWMETKRDDDDDDNSQYVLLRVANLPNPREAVTPSQDISSLKSEISQL